MKLKTLSFTYRTETERLTFSVVVNVSPDGEFYFATDELPKEVYAVGKKCFDGFTYKSSSSRRDLKYARTMKEIPKAIEEAVEKYESSLAVREESKVIVYKFELRGLKLAERPNPDDAEDPLPAEYFGGKDRYNRQDELSISLEWHILRKITDKLRFNYGSKDKTMYLDMEGREKNVYEDDEDGERIIKWTQEREDWFRSLENQMRSMMLGIEKFMGLEEKALQKIISSNQLLLEARK